MSDRGRGVRGGGDRSRGRGGGQGFRGSSRGGYGGGGGGGGGHDQKPKKESILDLSKYMDKKIRVKFNGGREAVGTLKGYDPLLNLVLDDTEENLRDPEDNRLLNETRTLGLAVLRGTAVILISPIDGSEEIANPFLQA